MKNYSRLLLLVSFLTIVGSPISAAKREFYAIMSFGQLGFFEKNMKIGDTSPKVTFKRESEKLAYLTPTGVKNGSDAIAYDASKKFEAALSQTQALSFSVEDLKKIKDLSDNDIKTQGFDLENGQKIDVGVELKKRRSFMVYR